MLIVGGGARQVGNMVNNLILWACISANYEGFKIGERPMPWAEKDMMMVLAEADAARISPAFCCVIKEVINCIKVERGEA